MTIIGLTVALACCLSFILGQKYGEKTERKWFVDFIEKNMEK